MISAEIMMMSGVNDGNGDDRRWCLWRWRVNHDEFVKKIAPPTIRRNENESEYVQLTSITLTAWSNYLCSNAQIEEEEAIKNLNPHIHTMGASSFVGD